MIESLTAISVLLNRLLRLLPVCTSPCHIFIPILMGLCNCFASPLLSRCSTTFFVPPFAAMATALRIRVWPTAPRCCKLASLRALHAHPALGSMHSANPPSRTRFWGAPSNLFSFRQGLCTAELRELRSKLLPPRPLQHLYGFRFPFRKCFASRFNWICISTFPFVCFCWFPILCLTLDSLLIGSYFPLPDSYILLAPRLFRLIADCTSSQ